MTTSNEHNNAPAPAPAQERCSTCGYLTSEREHLGCLRRAVKDLDIATGGPYDAQGVGLTNEQKTWAVNQLMGQAQVFASVWSLVGGRFDFGNAREEAEKAKTELRSMVVDALRAKGGKHV